MDRFFSVFGKLALVILVIGVIATGGYYLGTGKLPFPISPPPAAVSTVAPEPSPSPTPTDERILTTTPLPTVSQPATVVSSQTVSAGGPRGATFSPYTVTVPASWTVTKDDVPNTSYKLTVSQGNYSMVIYQVAAGAGPCVYPGDQPQAMAQTFGPFTTIHDSFGNEYRRATPMGNASGFTVCQRGPAYFNTSTMYGFITYTAPANPDPAILTQMDMMFATLKD